MARHLPLTEIDILIVFYLQYWQCPLMSALIKYLVECFYYLTEMKTRDRPDMIGPTRFLLSDVPGTLWK